jgi:hypothetical protein
MDCGAAWTRAVLAIPNAARAIADIMATLPIVLSLPAFMFDPPPAFHD